MKKIQFVILSCNEETDRKIASEILSIKKRYSSFRKEVHYDPSNGYYITRERFWRKLKRQYGSDLCYVGEIDL